MRSLLVVTLVLLACGGHEAPPAHPVAAARPPAPAPTPPTLRLPDGVRPTRGSLDLVLDPAVETFSGRASYEVTVAAATPVVWLNATGLTLTTVTGNGARAAVVPGNDDFVGLAFDPPLPAGTATLVIDYQGKLDSTKSLGFYRVADKPDEWYIYSFFEPIDARRAFPCFDEPSAKIPWRIVLHVPAADVALANTAMTTETPEAGGKKKVEFAETRPLPSYLVALIVGPFELIDGGTAGNHGTPLRFAVPRGRGADTRYAREVTPKIVGLLEDFFGMPYPYGKLDVAVVPRYWGTMEHPGLVALGQPLTLIRPEDESIVRQRWYTDIAAHELAHYWFGDYVTTAWWDDTWLNEAAAQWVDARIADGIEPSWQFAIERVGDMSAAMSVDALPSAKKIRQPVAAKDDIANAFDAAITYTKGASVMRMFEEYLGEERWRDFVRGYLDAHKWGTATAEDFLGALAKAAGPEIADGFRGFLDRPGFPLVSVKLACDKGAPPRLALAQSRFAPPGVDAGDETTWAFPVCAHWKAGKKDGIACTWLGGKTGELVLGDAPGCPDWVMANARAAGYYRVEPDPALARSLLATAGAALPLIERVDFFADVGALVKIGRLPVAQALAAVPTLARERNRYLVGASLDIMSAIRRDALEPPQRAQLARFIGKTYGARAHALGFVPKRGESDDVRQQRPLLLRLVGLGADDAALLLEARKLAGRWLDDRHALAPDVLRIALSLAAAGGDRALYDRMVAEVRKSTDSAERTTLFAALGSFRDPGIAESSLGLILGSDFDLRDTITILFVRLGPIETRPAAWSWLKAHFNDLMSRMREDEQMQVFELPGSLFCDDASREDVAAFMGERAKAVPGAPRQLDNTLDQIRVCVAGQKLNAAEITKFLSRY